MSNENNKGVLLPLASIILALVSVLATSYIQLESNKSSYQLKVVEITYEDKKKVFVELVKSLSAFKALANSDAEFGLKADTVKLKNNLDLALLNASLFIDSDVYNDCEVQAYEIVEKSMSIFYTKIDAAYLSEDYMENYYAIINKNLESIRKVLHSSLTNSKI